MDGERTSCAYKLSPILKFPLFPFIIPFMTTGRVFPEALTLLRVFTQAESSAWQFQKTVSVWKDALRGVLYLRV